MKRKLTKIALIFFGIMIVFTILSRVSYNFNTPKVMLGNQEDIEMGEIINGNGIVEAQEIVPVSAKEQKVVKKIHVLTGQLVKSGEVLYELDLEKLQEEIKEKEQELKTMELQIESARSMERSAEQSRILIQSQAASDYERAKQSADREIASAEAAWENAKNEYRKFQDNPSLYPDRIEEEFLQKVQDTKQAYESAVVAKDERLYQAQKAIDSANISEAKDTSVEQNELAIANIEEELLELKELQAAEGKVYSPVDGVVSAVNVQVGGVTSGTADILIADASSEMILKAQFSDKDKEYVTNGAEVELVSDVLMEKEKNIQGKLKVSAVRQNPEMPGMIEAVIRIPQNTLSIGSSVGVQVITNKKMYSSCIPLEALHQEEGEKYYVYTIGEKKTILGTEVVAKRVDVTIQYKGNQYAAVGGLSMGQKVIVFSTKQIQDGGRVKPQEQ